MRLTECCNDFSCVLASPSLSPKNGFAIFIDPITLGEYGAFTRLVTVGPWMIVAYVSWFRCRFLSCHFI